MYIKSAKMAPVASLYLAAAQEREVLGQMPVAGATFLTLCQVQLVKGRVAPHLRTYLAVAFASNTKDRWGGGRQGRQIKPNATSSFSWENNRHKTTFRTAPREFASSIPISTGI